MREKNGNQTENVPEIPELTLRDLYYRGVFERKLFSVEDVLIDLHNRRIEADLCARNGDLDAASYADLLSQIASAEDYFHAGVSAAWFEDEGFTKDAEGRVTEADGEEVTPLPVEKVREGMQAFLGLVRKNGKAERGEIPLRKVYEAGVFRYGDFTVEEAAIDVHNRLTEAYLALDRLAERMEEAAAHGKEPDLKAEAEELRERIRELREAKSWADGELVKVHFLMTDISKDAYGRYVKRDGVPVSPIDDRQLQKEYEEYLRMVIRQQELKKSRFSGIVPG